MGTYMVLVQPVVVPRVRTVYLPVVGRRARRGEPSLNGIAELLPGLQRVPPEQNYRLSRAEYRIRAETRQSAPAWVMRPTISEPNTPSLAGIAS